MARSRDADKRNSNTGDDDIRYEGQANQPNQPDPDDSSDTDDTSAGNSSNWRQLEDAKKKADQEAARYKELAFASIAQLAGYDPSKGITKRLIAEYEGDPTPGAFAEFAKSEGLDPNASAGAGGNVNSQGTGSRQPSETEQGMETLQRQSDNLRGQSQEGTSSTFSDELQKAQSEGRWADVVALGVKQSIAQSG